MSMNPLTVQCTPTIVESYVGFEDATREGADICCAQRAVHLCLKSLPNNMLVLSHKDKALTTWCPFSSCYNGFVFRHSLWIIWSTLGIRRMHCTKMRWNWPNPVASGSNSTGTVHPYRGNKL